MRAGSARRFGAGDRASSAHAENDQITHWKVHFKYADGGTWVSAIPQVIDTPNVTCLAGTNFYMTVQ